MNNSKDFLENFYELIFSIIEIKNAFLELDTNPEIKDCRKNININLDNNIKCISYFKKLYPK